MPKNVMKLLKPSPNYGRNDFDESHRHLFAANFGELIPGSCIETVPNDKILIRISDLVRAQPMVTSPFLRAKQHCDIWFVPYNLMWSKFDEFLVDKDEPASSSLREREFVPWTDLDEIQFALDKYYTSNPRYTDIHSRQCYKQIARNLDLLGYSGTLLLDSIVSSLQYQNKGVNLWRILAYNLIWYREYRQQYYDDGKYLIPSSLVSNPNAAAFLFNMDFLECSTQANAKLAYSQYSDYRELLAAMLQPRYRCWKKDLYTGLLPSTQFGNVSLVSDNVFNGRIVLENTTSWLGTPATADTFLGTDNAVGLRYGSDSLSDTALRSAVSSSFDILALRKSEAIQKWRENALRAGNQVQDNFEAHYGVKPQSHMDVHPQHVASFDAPLNIGDIMSTAETGAAINGVVGDVAGKGIMSFSGDQTIKFETNDFGVLMCIYSILPEAEYNSNGVDRMNCLLEREDYFFNEYENLGLEAVDRSVVTNLGNTSGILGYAPRYFGYKQKLDRVCGEFQDFQGYHGQFSPWVAPKFDVDDSVPGQPVPLSTLYVNPDVFNNNFHYANNVVDQFVCDFYVDCEAIRQMSVSGMPGY